MVERAISAPETQALSVDVASLEIIGVVPLTVDGTKSGAAVTFVLPKAQALSGPWVSVDRLATYRSVYPDLSDAEIEEYERAGDLEQRISDAIGPGTPYIYKSNSERREGVRAITVAYDSLQDRVVSIRSRPFVPELADFRESAADPWVEDEVKAESKPPVVQLSDEYE